MTNPLQSLQLDRRFKIFASTLLVTGLVFAMGLSLHSQRQALEASVNGAKERYLRAMLKISQYEALTKDGDPAHSVVFNEPLFSYVQKIINELKLNSRIDFVRPETIKNDNGSTTELVHLAFKNVTLVEFSRFLYSIEVQRREIVVKAATISKNSRNNLDTQLTMQRLR